MTEKQRQERKERYKYVKEHINSGNPILLLFLSLCLIIIKGIMTQTY